MNLQELKNKANMVWHIDQYEAMIGRSNSFYNASSEFIRAITRMKYLVLASQSFDDKKYRYYYNTLVLLFDASSYKIMGNNRDYQRMVTTRLAYRKQYKKHLSCIKSIVMD